VKSPLPRSLSFYRLNRTLHGRSVYRPKSIPGHNLFMSGGDGLDAFCPAGTPVTAMHAGKVVRISPDRNAKKTYIIIEGNGAKSLYAHIHIKDGLNVGDTVREGQVIGYVGRLLNDPHPHIELSVNGKPVAGRTAKVLAAKIDRLCM
jgi:murein DD-endopeptidase MepM/ murein hydrolase activator NlpD